LWSPELVMSQPVYGDNYGGGYGGGYGHNNEGQRYDNLQGSYAGEVTNQNEV